MPCSCLILHLKVAHHKTGRGEERINNLLDQIVQFIHKSLSESKHGRVAQNKPQTLNVSEVIRDIGHTFRLIMKELKMYALSGLYFK